MGSHCFIVTVLHESNSVSVLNMAARKHCGRKKRREERRQGGRPEERGGRGGEEVVPISATTMGLNSGQP